MVLTGSIVVMVLTGSIVVMVLTGSIVVMVLTGSIVVMVLTGSIAQYITNLECISWPDRCYTKHVDKGCLVTASTYWQNSETKINCAKLNNLCWTRTTNYTLHYVIL